ncbi:class I SAM-dependent methyltransferase [Sinimarinibacterium sp. NLF-5-8]|uniref:class I SAM-dependent methyltransferase n=1 Tax=Sinimarinibacterium sp. NLF-5-8 TaxID=2698684 RepID=UPI00137BD185|nr:class I SAM-dependent methyltransferase [Sinimarinibacterium sp. NLF-5-8]QHS09215.1 class I SAM-dependent methyltransferase [Sinimarinibacterium sp. NLF-5-8]
MSFYDRHILPHLLDCACGMGQVMKARAQIVPRARGKVLELGIGSGLNLQFYDPQKVTAIFGVDPSAELQRKARARAQNIAIAVETVPLVIEQIDAEDASYDTVLCTFTLCTIPDPVPAIQELRRVLKPGGEFLFCEHGIAPDAHIHRWQDRLNPLWKPLAGGCNLNRDIPELIRAGGFNIVELKQGYLPGPKPMTYVYSGVATAI